MVESKHVEPCLDSFFGCLELRASHGHCMPCFGYGYIWMSAGVLGQPATRDLLSETSAARHG